MFDSLEVAWKGETRTVEPDKVMRVLAALEDEITFIETTVLVAEAVNSGKRKQIKVSAAYASFLRACGFKVTTEDVIDTLDFSAYVACCIELGNVLKLTLHPDERKRIDAIMSGEKTDHTETKATPPKKTPARNRSSGKSTQR